MTKRNYLEFLALIALFVTFFGFFAVKVWDIDFWWHIAAGKRILEGGAIPSVDPFGVYDAASVWGQTVLKSQWLGQALLSWVYSCFDVGGIIYFRASVLTLSLIIVYFRCRLANTTGLFSFAITALSGLAILHHTGERPQLFSFLYISLIFLLLDGFARSGKHWLLYCIPLVMLVWSNTHGGALLGVVVLGLFGAGYILESRLSGHINFPEARLMLLIIGLSAVALVLAPNGLTTLQYIIALESNPIRDRASEYTSPWSLWPVTLYYWVFVGVALASLPGFIKKIYWKQGIVVAVLGVISTTAYRYIPLFVLPAAPYVAASLSRMFIHVKPPANIVNILVLVVALCFLGFGFRQGQVFQHGVLERKFPVGAVAFIKANKLGGKMFNSMNWGGYLIWHLYPVTTIFIDGRMLDPTRVAPYTNILWMTPEGRQFFENSNFDLVLIPFGNAFSGERYPILDYLRSNADWRIAYQDRAGYLFIRNMP